MAALGSIRGSYDGQQGVRALGAEGTKLVSQGSGPSNPTQIPSAIGVVADGVYIVGGLGNALSIDVGDSVVQIDTGTSAAAADVMMQLLAAYTRSPVGTIVYSHGHLGYNFGVDEWVAAAIRAGRAAPPIVAQIAAGEMIQRFRETTPMTLLLEALEFHHPIPTAPGRLPLTPPTVTFTDIYTVVGPARRVEIFSAPSETDGSIAAWIPDTGVIYAGPGCITELPNIGLPLRTPRDALRWASTLDRLASYEAAILVPQYGPVVTGADAVRDVFASTAEALRYVHGAVTAQLNAGFNLNEALQHITFPKAIFDLPFLGTGYGTRQDLVRAVWASAVGWWDRNPTWLRSAPEGDVAQAIRSAISDPGAVLARAEALRENGDRQLALHVVDLLALAPGGDEIVLAARALKAALCYELAEVEENFTRQSLYRSAGDIISNPPSVPTGVR